MNKMLLENMTVYEKEVMPFVLNGCNNKVIARKLNISPDTVKARLTGLYKKFEVKNRIQLITLFISNNLI